MDKIIGIVEARQTLPKVVKTVARGKRVVITQRSHPVAVLVSLDEIETLEILADKQLMADLVVAKQEIRQGRGTPLEDFLKDERL